MSGIECLFSPRSGCKRMHKPRKFRIYEPCTNAIMQGTEKNYRRFIYNTSCEYDSIENEATIEQASHLRTTCIVETSDAWIKKKWKTIKKRMGKHRTFT